MARKNKKTNKRKKRGQNKSNQNREKEIVHLPPEMMGEIFYRLPLESLLKCTSVNKFWNSFIKDYSFIFSHVRHNIPASNENGAIFLRLDKTMKWPNNRQDFIHGEFYSIYDDKVPDRFLFVRSPFHDLYRSIPHSIIMVGTCYGLICYAYCFYPVRSKFNPPHILIWNPMVRKYLLFPTPTVVPPIGRCEDIRNWISFGFGFDFKQRDFKVVRMISVYNVRDVPKNECLLLTPQVEVFSMATHSWKSITVGIPQLAIVKYYREMDQIFVNGKMHWLAGRKGHDGHIQNFILSFDVGKERFGEIPLPPHLREPSGIASVLTGGDLLALVHTYRKGVQPSDHPANWLWGYSIWVMKQYGVAESWTEVFQSDSRSHGNIAEVLGLSGSGKVVSRLSAGTIALIDPVADSVKPLGDRRCMKAAVGAYVPSLYLMNEPHVLPF